MLNRAVKPMSLILGLIVFGIFSVTLAAAHGDRSDIVQGVGGVLLSLWIICTSFPRQTPEADPDATR